MASEEQQLEIYATKHLRGLSDTRWGGHKSNRMRGFKGSTYGTAIKGQHIQLTPKLVPQWERRYSVNQVQRLRINGGVAGHMPPLPVMYS